MKSILVLCYSDPHSDPRPQRMIECLSNDYQITIASAVDCSVEKFEFIRIKRKDRTRRQQAVHVINNILRRYERIIWPDNLSALKSRLASRKFDLIISHNLQFLPLALALKREGKVLFDAREYYPSQYEDRLGWKILSKGATDYLCSRYMPLSDFTITVSDGIAREYYKRFEVNAEVVQSLPIYCELSPSSVDPGRIRIVHHGRGKSSRRIEQMIEAMDYVDERFQLDLMLVNTERKYSELLYYEVNRRRNVCLIDPVKFSEIISFTNQYDIGLFNAYPSTFNLKHMLPNKLFEYIQARLAVVIGPSVEMEKIVEKHDVGIIARDFRPRSIADALNSLTIGQIQHFKERSNQAARELNAERNCARIRQVVSELVGD